MNGQGAAACETAQANYNGCVSMLENAVSTVPGGACCDALHVLANACVGTVATIDDTEMLPFLVHNALKVGQLSGVKCTIGERTAGYERLAQYVRHAAAVDDGLCCSSLWALCCVQAAAS